MQQVQDTSRAVVPYLRQFNDEEKSLIGALLAQVAPQATNQEKALFLYTAQKKGLDPFDKQIYLIPRWDSVANCMKHSVQVSIDGLRLMAQRSGKYAGQTPYQWCGKDGQWVDVWVLDEHPVAARVGVMRHDFKAPVYSVALFKSYKQTKKDGKLTVFWEKFDTQMLAKCAEALSIRRAFPEETSGFYIPEEMGNPELTYVMEVENDSNAPFVKSEVVDPHEPTTSHATNRTTQHSTNGTPIRNTSTATASSSTPTSTKTQEPPKDKKFVKVDEKVALTELPTVSQLQAEIADLKPQMAGKVMSWEEVLAYVCKKQIAESQGALTVAMLVEAGTQLPPQYAERVAGFVASIKKARSTQASTGK